MTEETKPTETPEPKATPETKSVSKADDLFHEMKPREDVQLDVLYDTVQKSIEGARAGELNRDAIARAAVILKQATGDPEDDSPTAKVESELWAAVQKDAEGHDVGRLPPTKKLEDVAKRWNEEPTETTAE